MILKMLIEPVAKTFILSSLTTAHWGSKGLIGAHWGSLKKVAPIGV